MNPNCSIFKAYCTIFHHSNESPDFKKLKPRTKTHVWIVFPSLPSKCVESTEYVGQLLVVLIGHHLALATLHEFGRDLRTGAVLQKRLHGFLQLRQRQLDQRLGGGGRGCVTKRKRNTTDEQNILYPSSVSTNIMSVNCRKFRILVNITEYPPHIFQDALFGDSA